MCPTLLAFFLCNTLMDAGGPTRALYFCWAPPNTHAGMSSDYGGNELREGEPLLAKQSDRIITNKPPLAHLVERGLKKAMQLFF